MFVVPFDVDHIGVQRIVGAVEKLHKLQQAVLVAKLVGLIGPLIEDADDDTGVEKAISCSRLCSTS